MGRASDFTGRRVNAWHSSIQHNIRPSAEDSVREKAAVATQTPTDNICSYSYSSTYDESETYSDVETEDDEEDPQLKNRFYVLTAPANELRTAQSMAAPAGRTTVKTKNTIKTTVAPKSAHAAFKPYAAASSWIEEQEEAKSSTKCLRAASSAHSSRNEKKLGSGKARADRSCGSRQRKADRACRKKPVAKNRGRCQHDNTN